MTWAAKSWMVLTMFTLMCGVCRGQEWVLKPSSVAGLQLSTTEREAPPPCVCKCGGKTQCERGQWAYCECREGHCETKCTTEKHEPMQLAADVVSAVRKQPVEVNAMKNEARAYAPLLHKLIYDAKVSEGTYTLTYDRRQIGLSFTQVAVKLLTDALHQLE
jgi:hypothetical protein